MLSNPREGVRPGEVVGEKYVVERIIGFGGMGTVVSATDTLLNRRVAIKFLLPEFSEKPAAVGRFLREARATAGLQSPHVVRVIDAGTRASGTPYIVMEYLDGRDLGEYLRSAHPLPVGDAVDLLLQAGEAVAEAHSIGVVHRDLKPSNLFVTDDLDGRRKVTVLDFGISMFLESSGMSDGRALTGTGDMIGSPLYMSPEQIRDAHRVTAQTDIWALGVILYELLVGISPFQSETMTAICARIVSEPPPSLRQKRADVPKKLEQVILACLEKRVSRRIQTVAELARRLAPFANDGHAARRIAAMASRDRRVSVSPSGRPYADSIDPSGPTLEDLGSGWSVRRNRRNARLRVAAVAALVIGAGVWALHARPPQPAAPEVIIVATTNASAPLPVHRDETDAASAAMNHEVTSSPTIEPNSVRASSSPSSLPVSHPKSGHSSSAATTPASTSAAPIDSATVSPAALHPTLEQALDSRK